MIPVTDSAARWAALKPVMTSSGAPISTTGISAQAAPIGSGVSGSTMSAADWGAAGASAIGTGIQTAAAAAAEAQRRNDMINEGSANRGLTEKMAKRQLAESKDAFQQRQTQGAYGNMLNAYFTQLKQGMEARDVRRGAANGIDALLSMAMLRK